MILASNSEQRKKLITMLFPTYKNLVAETEEIFDENLSIYNNLQNVSYEKAKAVTKKYDILDDYVLGVDTVVYFNGSILLKPKSYEEAFEMIKSYKDCHQEVISGITLLKVVNNKIVAKKSSSVISKVKFNSLKDKDINNWLNLGLYKYCSGGFMIEKVENDFKMDVIGSYSNIIGLPLEQLKEFCEDFGIHTLDNQVEDINLVKSFMQ